MANVCLVASVGEVQKEGDQEMEKFGKDETLWK